MIKAIVITAIAVYVIGLTIVDVCLMINNREDKE